MGIGLKVRRLALLAGMAACAFGLSAAEAAEKYKIFLSMSYIGNDWQAEAANMVKAMAAHKSHGRQGRPAGPGRRARMRSARSSRSTPWCRQAPRPSSIFPISPTALNQVVKNACDKGVHGLRL